MLKFFLLLIILSNLQSCSSIKKFFEEDEVKLIGNRVDVFDKEEIKFVRSNQTVILQKAELITNWSQTNHNKSNHLFHFLSNSSLKFKWKLKVGKGKSRKGPYIVKPIVHNSNIITIDNDSKIQSREYDNGAIVWTKELVDENRENIYFSGGLAAQNDDLFISTVLGNLYCLEASSGKLKWKKNFLTPISSSPTLSNNKIFVVTDDNQTFAIDYSSGEKIWTHSGNLENISIIGGVNPAIKERVVYVTYSSGEIFALNEDNGSVLWEDNLTSGKIFNKNLISDIQSPPVINDELLYVSSFINKFAAIQAIDGERVWELDISSLNPITISGDYLFILDVDNRVYCLSKKDGKIVWIAQLKVKGDDNEIYWVGPILTSNKLILASSEGVIISLSPFTGETLSVIKRNESFTIQPIQSQKTIFFVTEQGRLIAFE